MMLSRKQKNLIDILIFVPVFIVFVLNLSIVRHFRNDNTVNPNLEQNTGELEDTTNFSELTEEPSENEKTNIVDTILSQAVSRMTTTEKIGQLLMMNFYGDDLDDVEDLITNYGIGGFMMNAANIRYKSYRQVKNRNEELHGFFDKIPVFISVDQEGGKVARLTGVLDSYPAPAVLYEEQGEDGVVSSAQYFSENMSDLGFDINFAPVVDVIKRSGTVIDDRVFTADIDENIRLSQMYIDAFYQNGLITVPKHFPGHGNLEEDPHDFVCVDNDSSLEEMAHPFLELTNIYMLMTAHVSFTKYDQLPATLSPVIISYIREKGYSNVIITDDIQMDSISDLYLYTEASLLAILAGCDIVLSVAREGEDWYFQTTFLHDYLMEAYETGELPREIVNEAVKRILKVKMFFFPDFEWELFTEEEREALNIGPERDSFVKEGGNLFS